MITRVDLSKKITLEEFKKEFGHHYTTDAKLLKAYEAAVAKFPKPEQTAAKEEPVKDKPAKADEVAKEKK